MSNWSRLQMSKKVKYRFDRDREIKVKKEKECIYRDIPR